MGLKRIPPLEEQELEKMEILQDALEKNIVPVITGFQGFDDENNITT